jgi:glutathione synthase/RimK-type ligase-like ATP-grasp enzyme
MKYVLVIGQQPDPHIEVIRDIVTKKGSQVVLFDMYRPEDSKVGLVIDQTIGSAYIVSKELTLGLSEISSIWWRVKPFIYKNSDSGINGLWTEFAQREWQKVLNSLEFFASNALFVNSRISDFYASNKCIQLMIAKEVGFNIPNTLVSNDSSNISSFLNANGDTIYKTISWYSEPPDKVIFTSRVTIRDIQSSTESIRISPGIFQKRIEKKYELRITTIGSKFFAVSIDSQKRSDTLLDWRRNQFDLNYSSYKLPKRIKQMIAKMNKKLGLNYAAYDFIVTPDNEYCFLEVNPLGQWLWIEHKTNLPISLALAELLLS